jgi:hypothetical protein
MPRWGNPILSKNSGSGFSHALQEFRKRETPDKIYENVDPERPTVMGLMRQQLCVRSSLAARVPVVPNRLPAVPAYRLALGIPERGEEFAAGLAANSAASWRFCRRSDLYRQHRRVSNLGSANRVEAIETGPQAGAVGAELTDLDPVAFRNIGR